MKRIAFPTQCLRLVLLGSASVFLSVIPSAAGAVVFQAFERPLAPNINHREGYLSPYVVDGKSYFFQWKLAPYAVDLDGNGTTDLTFGHKLYSGFHNLMHVSLTGRSQIWARAGGIDGHYSGRPFHFLKNAPSSGHFIYGATGMSGGFETRHRETGPGQEALEGPSEGAFHHGKSIPTSQSGSERRARENRNKCRRPSEGSYAGFSLSQRGGPDTQEFTKNTGVRQNPFNSPRQFPKRLIYTVSTVRIFPHYCVSI